MKQTKYLTILATLLAGSILSKIVAAQTCSLSHIEFITEHSPPYTYLEDGQAQGSAVEAVLALTRAAGCPISRDDISFQPWARGYRSALNSKNKAIFSIIKTEQRAPLFQWVGPIDQGTYGLLAKRERHFDLSTENSRAGYLYGAIREDVGEKYLQQLHIPEERITRAVLGSSMAKILKAGRVDLWAYSELSAKNALKTIGADPNDYVIKYLLAKNEFYLAFSLDVDKQIVGALQKAHARLVATTEEAGGQTEAP